jgi:CubicO group peptidase (beta-lactamase class C family)
MMDWLKRKTWQKRLGCWLGAAWLLGLGAGSTLAQTYDFSAVTAEFEANLDDYDGRVLAIVEQGNRGEIFRFRSGLVTDQSKTGLASASKWLSGAVVLICAERGFFSLDDRIGRYLPAFEAAGKGDITIRQCFAMTSGLSLKDPNYESDG